LVPHGVESIPRHLVPPACDHDSHCITCGDEAVPLRVVRIDEVRELALCENDAGERTTVEIALVEPVSLNDVVLVHAGTAIARETA
jgi:hydrogenase maturation factor